MRKRIDYQTHWFSHTNGDGALPFDFSFDAIEPVACRGLLMPRFAFTFRHPGAATPTVRLFLRDPDDATHQKLLYSAAPLPLDPTGTESSFTEDCCCEGQAVPFARGDGPLPRMRLVFETTGVGAGVVLLETWWEPIVDPEDYGTRVRGARGILGATL